MVAPGADTMIAGIVFQLASLLVFSGLFGLFLVRAQRLESSPRSRARSRSFNFPRRGPLASASYASLSEDATEQPSFLKDGLDIS